jgi:hypothetical protein
MIQTPGGVARMAFSGSVRRARYNARRDARGTKKRQGAFL